MNKEEKELTYGEHKRGKELRKIFSKRNEILNNPWELFINGNTSDDFLIKKYGEEGLDVCIEYLRRLDISGYHAEEASVGNI